VTAGKRRRAEYRRALGARGGDRFSEHMEALIGGGSEPCACCRLVRPRSALSAAGVCDPCRQSLGGLREAPPAPTEASRYLPAGCVYVDASYRDGVAGLAVVGALGEHARLVAATTSTQAETMALRWAMEIAHAADARNLTFRTDCSTALAAVGSGSRRRGWVVEQIPRYRNRQADALANSIRLASSEAAA
jgi:hypothetical protein